MILNFLRKLRRIEINQNTGRYLKYAIGEIFLVVIGILLALTINNWNEERKRHNYEMLLLNEIKIVLERDRSSIDLFYLTRLEGKENAVKYLSRMAGGKRQISDKTFIRLYANLGTDFLYTFDSGPYEALKTNGLDRLKNDSLRSMLIRTYDDLLPTFKQFIDNENTFALEEIKQHQNDFIGDRMTQDPDGVWNVTNDLIVKDVLSHSSFIRVLKLESGKAANQRNRLTVVAKVIDDLLLAVTNELDQNK